MMLAILNYHHVATVPSGTRLHELYVSPEEFARQLWWLRRLGFVGVSLGEGMRLLQAGGSRRHVAITFDDAYLDNVITAVPILQEYRFGATLFVVSERIGSYNSWDAEQLSDGVPLMTVAQLEAWADAGFEIGSHTCTHQNLTTLSREAALTELLNSRESLQALTGQPVPALAYPYGAYNADTLKLVAKAGYRAAVTTRRGRAHYRDDPLALPRLPIYDHTRLGRFLVKAATPYTDLRHPLGGSHPGRARRRDPHR